MPDKPKHCVFCGSTHTGKCNDSYFAHFKCECGEQQKLPFDVVGFMDGIICNCGRVASDAWSPVKK